MGQLVLLIDQEDMSNVLKSEFRQLLSKVAIIMVHQSIGLGYLTVSQKRGVQLPYEPPLQRNTQEYH